jgi:hypothetical protein
MKCAPIIIKEFNDTHVKSSKSTKTLKQNMEQPRTPLIDFYFIKIYSDFDSLQILNDI